MQLTCPKCQGAMRQYERSGVHVDQCTECRGIFLDRGELERLIDAEASWNASATAPAAAQVPAPSRPQPAYQQQPYQQGGHDRGQDQRGYGDRSHGEHGYSEHGYGHKKKKKSFLEDLFD